MSNEARRSPRLAHEMMVQVSSGAGAGTFSGWGTNLSEGGVFVNAPGAPPGMEVGGAIDVLLQLPGKPECKLRGRIVRAKASGEGVAEPGLAIQFVDPDEATRALIRELMARLGKDLGTQAV